VLVIDELSRADVGRVFGEALTYIERSKRGQHFMLPSGAPLHIPTNLHVIATMNPLDRGVDEVDAAFERRFAKIDMQPDRTALEDILRVNGLDSILMRRLLAWFSRVNSSATHNPASAVGHAYFADVVDAESLRDVWDYQLQYLVARAFQYDPDSRADVTKGWFSIFDHEPEDQVIQSADGDGSPA
jgi:5-methylcytosine-specific restriction enzyme B